jgi:hypothetical protein
MCELLHSVAAGCNLELPAYFGISVEAHTSIKIANQPFPQVHDLCAASPFMSQLEVPVLASLE